MTKEEVKNEVFLNQEMLNTVSEKTISQYEDFVKTERAINHGLLGSVVNGEYVIPNKLKELFVMNKKLLTKRENDFLIAKMDRRDKTLTFKLTFDDFDNISMIAEFYLVEKINDDEIETFIANYVDVKNYEFKQKAREVFNILLEEDVYSKEEGEDFLELDKVIFRNSTGKSDERVFVLETYAELFMEEVLNELEKGGELSKKVLVEYKQAIKEQGYLKGNIPHIYIKLKETMDQVIENNGGVKALVADNKEIGKTVEKYIEPVKDYDKAVETIDVLARKQEQAEERKEKAKGKESAREEKPSSKGSSTTTKKPEKKAAAKKNDNKKSGSSSSSGKDKKKGTSNTPGWTKNVTTGTKKGDETPQNEKGENKLTKNTYVRDPNRQKTAERSSKTGGSGETIGRTSDRNTIEITKVAVEPDSSNQGAPKKAAPAEAQNGNQEQTHGGQGENKGSKVINGASIDFKKAAVAHAGTVKNGGGEERIIEETIKAKNGDGREERTAEETRNAREGQGVSTGNGSDKSSVEKVTNASPTGYSRGTDTIIQQASYARGGYEQRLGEYVNSGKERVH